MASVSEVPPLLLSVTIVECATRGYEWQLSGHPAKGNVSLAVNTEGNMRVNKC